MLNELLLSALGESLALTPHEAETVGEYAKRVHATVWTSAHSRKYFSLSGHWFVYTAKTEAGDLTCEGLD
jgi:VanZ family protein